MENQTTQIGQSIKNTLIEKIIEQNEDVESMLDIMDLYYEDIISEVFEDYLERQSIETLVGML